MGWIETVAQEEPPEPSKLLRPIFVAEILGTSGHSQRL